MPLELMLKARIGCAVRSPTLWPLNSNAAQCMPGVKVSRYGCGRLPPLLGLTAGRLPRKSRRGRQADIKCKPPCKRVPAPPTKARPWQSCIQVSSVHFAAQRRSTAGPRLEENNILLSETWIEG